MLRLLFVFFLSGLPPLVGAELKVAVLHPLLGDIVRKVGGSQVETVDLIGPNGDPHHFEPKPEDLTRADGAKLYFVAGMGLEGYLPKLKGIIGNQAKIVEVGKTLPALESACDEEDHGHHSHTVDPHWWHSIDLFRRATDIIAAEMAAQSPALAPQFMENATRYRTELDLLERWAKREISRIPRERRHLATAHAAFNYFCKDFGFTPHPVQGINREQMPDPKALAKLVEEIKKAQVVAIFPERESNPKILLALTTGTGIRLGDPLIADGTGVMDYATMVRSNVNVIVKALSAD